MDRTEEKLSKTLQHLESSEKARDDAECHLRSLENAEQTNFDRLDQQEQQLKLAKSSANDSDRKYEGNYSKILVIQKLVAMKFASHDKDGPIVMNKIFF